MTGMVDVTRQSQNKEQMATRSSFEISLKIMVHYKMNKYSLWVQSFSPLSKFMGTHKWVADLQELLNHFST